MQILERKWIPYIATVITALKKKTGVFLKHECSQRQQSLKLAIFS